MLDDDLKIMHFEADRIDRHRLNAVLETLKRAYGPAYFGHDVHTRRATSPGTTLVVAVERRSEQICGVAYVDINGKWGAIGVLTSHRRRGVARRLLESMSGRLEQFIEAPEDSNRVHQLALAGGFAPVVDPRRLLVALSSLRLAGTVIGQFESVYTRTSMRSGEILTLRLFERILHA